MTSALITVVLLLLGPGLAYFHSPLSLVKAGLVTAKAGVWAGMQRWSRHRAASVTYNDDWRQVLNTGSDHDRPNALEERTNAVGIRVHDLRTLRSRWSVVNPGLWGAKRAVGRNSPDPLVEATEGADLHPDLLKAVQPWLRGGYLDGSGAGDPADNKHGTVVLYTCSSPQNVASLLYDLQLRPSGKIDPVEELRFHCSGQRRGDFLCGRWHNPLEDIDA